MNWRWTLVVEAVLSAILGSLIFYVIAKATSVLNLFAGRSKKGSALKSFFRDARDWLAITASFLLIFIVADETVKLEPYAKRAWLWMMRTFGLQTAHLLLATFTLALGTGAYFLKKNYQRFYGVVEVVFAFIAAIVTARQMKPDADWSGQIATLIGCVYVVSRGLGNFSEGQKKETERKEEEGKKKKAAAQAPVATQENAASSASSC